MCLKKKISGVRLLLTFKRKSNIGSMKSILFVNFSLVVDYIYLFYMSFTWTNVLLVLLHHLHGFFQNFAHIDSVITKANQALGFLLRNSSSCQDVDILKVLYILLGRPPPCLLCSCLVSEQLSQ